MRVSIYTWGGEGGGKVYNVTLDIEFTCQWSRKRRKARDGDVEKEIRRTEAN